MVSLNVRLALATFATSCTFQTAHEHVIYAERPSRNARGVGMLDWDDLRFFLAVARHRSLSAAARDLNVTQSTVGRRVVALESRLGARLLNRTPGGYIATLAGRSILAQVETLEATVLSVER
jgi:hypothetical protein